MAKERCQPAQNAAIANDGKPVPNPVMCKEGRGARNFNCAHYDFCLDSAAKEMWSGFTCNSCRLNPLREEETS